jgi:hypothetical protein
MIPLKLKDKIINYNKSLRRVIQDGKIKQTRNS